MNKVTRQLLGWVQQKALAHKHLAEALILTEALPSTKQQNQFLQWLLFVSGVLFIVSGAIFFFAFNWDNLHRFSKFAIVQIVFLICLLPLYKVKLFHPVAQLALAAAAVLLGGCLALVGQTYQTGADTYQLFLTWALLLLPWLALTQHVFITGLFVVLANLAWLMYAGLFFSFFSTESIWPLFILNLICLIVLEAYSRWRNPFMLGWLISALFSWLVLFTTLNEVDDSYTITGSLLAWSCLLAAGFYWYRYINLNLLRLSIIFLAITSYVIAKVAYFLSINHFLNWFTLVLLGAFFFGANFLAAKYLQSLRSSRKKHEI